MGREVEKVPGGSSSRWEEVVMCRMIVACGKFSVAEVVNAARIMAAGETGKHDGLIKQHTHGWGCLWVSNGQIRVLRGGDSFIEACSAIELLDADIDFLAVHVRHATLRKNRGVEFSHPLRRESGGTCWYMMHNGYLPTVYPHLGLSASQFDSAEYLEYIVGPIEPTGLGKDYLMSKLIQLAPGGSSGNFFLMTLDRAWVWQWFAEDTSCPEYFTLRHFKGEKVEYISSEIIPSLGDELEWRSMKNGELYEFDLKGVKGGRA